MTTPAAPGIVALFGSGETSASGRRIFEKLFAMLPQPIRMAILETPAGFELNSDWVAQQVADFVQQRLQNYHPHIDVIPARKRGETLGPDNPDILEPLYRANLLYMGAGSPTYGARQLRGTLAWHLLQARHRLGAMVILASASTLSASAYTLPVYEIYKVGEELHWKEGLNLFGPFGLELVFIPHWNNQDGGENLDTSRCFVGQPRFERLLAMLPASAVVVGVEEHTGLIFDLQNGQCHVVGRDGVAVLRGGHSAYYPAGQSFPLTELGAYRPPTLGAGLPAPLVEQAVAIHHQPPEAAAPVPSAEALALAAARQQARQDKDWAAADQLRARLAELGWTVRDTPDGPELVPMDG